MKLIFKKYFDTSILKSLQLFSSINILMPSFEELDNLITQRNEKPQIYQINLDDKTYALAIFFIENRRIHGINLKTFSLIGHDYFDYNFFYCENDVAIKFLQFISADAKKNNIDAIVLENILYEINDDFFTSKEKVFYFDSKVTSENGFQFIYKKKSLRRHYNAAVQQLDYSCEHKIAHFDNSDIEALAKIHCERWGFDNIQSAFCNNERISLYASYKKNKIMTVLRDKNEIIAMHYGMIFDDQLLWHTPAINIKYLEFSPIELLLFEISKFCENNCFSVLDFGLGNEKYKERLSNKHRDVGFKFIALSKKSYFLYTAMTCIDIKKVKHFFSNCIASIKYKLRKISKITSKINYYKFDHKNNLCTLTKSEEISLVIVDTFSDLVNIFRKNKISIKNFHYDRIKSGNLMLCLMKESSLLSFGWGTRSLQFFISEINKTVCNREKLMLYDFYTPSTLRGRGYYTLLLTKICEHYNKESLTIFSERKNTPSNKAILRAGFKRTHYFLEPR